jgi:hypothetical protein
MSFAYIDLFELLMAGEFHKAINKLKHAESDALQSLIHDTAEYFIEHHVNPAMIKKLLKVFPEQTEPLLSNFIDIAILYRNDKTAHVLLDAGANARVTSMALMCSDSIFWRLLEQKSFVCGEHGEKTALEIAIMKAYDIRAIALINAGADIHVHDDWPFENASYRVQAVMVKKDPSYNWKRLSKYPRFAMMHAVRQ